MSDIDEIPQTVPLDDSSLPDKRILRQTEMNPLDEGDVSQARFESPKRIVPIERRFILDTPPSSDGACEVASDEDLKKVNLSESVKPRESSHKKFPEKKDLKLTSYEFLNSSGEEFVPQPLQKPGQKSTTLQVIELTKSPLNFLSPKAQSTNALSEPFK